MESLNINELNNISIKVRRRIIDMIYRSQSGHIGGSFSCVEAMVSLYFHIMNLNGGEERDRFILSKGHAAPSLYAIMAEKGWIEESDLLTFRCLGSKCQGHPDSRQSSYIDMSSGSLGQGLSVGAGMAIAAKLKNLSSTIYILLGDGELNEGQNYEAMMFANHYKLDNMIALIDKNGLQLDGPTQEIMSTDPLEDKFSSFGWYTLSVDGHSFVEIINGIEKIKKVKKPGALLLNTIKGKGVSFMENKVKYHGAVPDSEEYIKALQELER